MTTDRAKRYAANRNVADDPKKGCLFCGSKRFLTVDHLSGDETDGTPANLAYLCKSCNTRKGATFAKAGIGRRTAQYNPDLGLSPEERRNFSQLGFDFPPRAEYDQARAASRKRKQADHTAELKRRREERKEEARRRAADRRAEQKGLREGISRLGAELQRARKAGDKEAARSLAAEINDMAGDLRRNPASAYSAATGGIRSPSQWQAAVAASLGDPSSYMTARSAAERIRSTSPAARRKFSQQMRPNPGKVPTYAQYAFAVSGYRHGKGDTSLKTVIDRVPASRRSEYARVIWGQRRLHGTEHMTGTSRETVPF